MKLARTAFKPRRQCRGVLAELEGGSTFNFGVVDGHTRATTRRLVGARFLGGFAYQRETGLWRCRRHRFVTKRQG